MPCGVVLRAANENRMIAGGNHQPVEAVQLLLGFFDRL